MQKNNDQKEEIMDMERGNILLIGKSGVGKSTLINAVLGEEKAKTSWGSNGTTDRLEMYESDKIPFRLIDTVGFEPSFIKEYRAIRLVLKRVVVTSRLM